MQKKRQQKHKTETHLERHEAEYAATEKVLFDDIDQAVRQNLATIQTRSAECDRVIRTPNDWLPDNFRHQAKSASARVLDMGYSVKEIRAFIADCIREYRHAFSNSPSIYRPRFVILPPVRTEIMTLAHIRRGIRLGPSKGLSFLTDERHARKVEIAQKYSDQQRINASRKRGAKSDIHKIIRFLALEREGEGGKALWDHFIGHLDKDSLNPKESTPPGDHRKWKVTYDYHYSDAARRSRTRRKQMVFGQFANLISHYRQEKKSG